MTNNSLTQWERSFYFQHGMIALNFAFDEEAEAFLQIVSITVKARNKKQQGYNILKILKYMLK